MLTAATSGVTSPATASGTVSSVVADRQGEVLPHHGAARAARSRARSATGASRSPWNTTSAAVWLMSAALAGDSETLAAASAGAVVEPVADHQHLAPGARQRLDRGDLLRRRASRPASRRCRARARPAPTAAARSPDSRSHREAQRRAAARIVAAASARSVSAKAEAHRVAAGPRQPQFGPARRRPRRSAAEPRLPSRHSPSGRAGRGPDARHLARPPRAPPAPAGARPAARAPADGGWPRPAPRGDRAASASSKPGPSRAPAGPRSACRSCRTRPCRPRPAAPAPSADLQQHAARASAAPAGDRPAPPARRAPSAQGQVMISTATAISSACVPGRAAEQQSSRRTSASASVCTAGA